MALTKYEYAGAYTGNGYYQTNYAITMIVSDLAIDQAHTILWLCAPGAGDYTATPSSPPLLTNGIGLQFANGVLPETVTINGTTIKFLYAIAEYNQYDDDPHLTNMYVNYLIPSYGFAYNPNGCVASGLSLGGRLMNYWVDGTFIPTIPVACFATFDGFTTELYLQANLAAVNSYIKSLVMVHNQNDPTVAYSTMTSTKSGILGAYPNYDITTIDGPSPGAHDSWTHGYLNSNSGALGTVNQNVYQAVGTKALQYLNLTVTAFTPPTVVVSPAQTIYLPTAQVSLTATGTVTQAGATIVSYAWTRTSGPTSGTITSPNGQNTTITGLTAGNYVYKVVVTDSKNSTVSGTVAITVNAAVVSPPVANSGPDQTIAPPPYSCTLNGTASSAPGSTITSYLWTQSSGPAGTTIVSNSGATTVVTGLVVGVYIFSLTITNGNGATATDTVQITVAAPTVITTSDTSVTANQGVPPYGSPFSYGSNLGYYQNSAGGTGFSNSQLGQIAATVGIRTMRVTLNDNYLNNNGLSSLIVDHAGYQAAGLIDTAAITGNADPTHCEVDSTGNRVLYPGCSYPSNMFQGIYNAIWTDQANKVINPLNLAAKFFHDVITTYGQYVKFWEVENEPDFTYAVSNAQASASQTGNWYTAAPPAASLPNLNCPPNYYIREMRIFYEVLKAFYPNSYVCTGGLGYVSFLDFILRSSDHPTDGTVLNSSYPYTGGAWFDVLSFHSYPFYGGGRYYTGSGFIYFNDSDAFANQLISDLATWQNTLVQYGYDGINRPKKKIIITEHNIPDAPISGNGGVGGVDVQADYLVKVTALLQKAGLAQVYVFNLGNANDSPPSTGASPFDYMGFFDNLRSASYGNQVINSQGFAMSTMTQVLYGYAYDAVKTGNLALPAGVNGVAFTKGTTTRYCLWAISQDPGTIAAAQYDFAYQEYSLPGVSGNVTQLWRDYARTGYSKSVPATVIPLTAKPCFILVAGDVIAPVTPTVYRSVALTPVFQATVYVEQPLSNVLLDGSLSTSPTAQITSYLWAKVSGPAGDTIVDPAAPQTVVKTTLPGVYVYSLTITN